MASSAPSIDPQTGERIADWRDQWPADIERPITPVRPSEQVQIDPATGERIEDPRIDPTTGERIGTTPSPIDEKTAERMLKAGVYGRMLAVPSGYAYQNIDEIDKQLRDTGGDDFDKGIGYAIETGFEETPLGLLIRGQAPDPFESHSHLGNFIHDVTEMISDPLMLASAFTSEAGVGIAGFAADAALRKTLMDQYEKGNVKNFEELADRAGGILWEAGKGALLAKAGMAAGEIPVGGFIGRSSLTASAMKGVYQSAVMTTAGALLNGQLPTMQDFERSAALIVPLNLATGGRFLKGGETEQALRDVYRETGSTPEESETKLAAQPPVTPDPEPGLRAAIGTGDSFTEADEGETHPELAERLFGRPPVSMDRLEADPELADEVLQNPTPHLQEVIDRAYQLKKEAIESGASDDELPNRASLKSGRGFVTPDGKFLERTQARAWVKENQPEVAEMWEEETGDRNAELHADDYGKASLRVDNRTVAKGEPDFDKVSTPLLDFLARVRTELNNIKSGKTSDGYGKSVLRTLWVGPRNALRAAGKQLVARLSKMVPDHVDQEAISFMRDYRDDPEQLRADIEEIRSGDNEKLKAFIPSMERALNPSPEMLQADAQITAYFSNALSEGRQFGTLDSTIDPSRYSPRLFMRAVAEGEEARKAGSPKFTTNTPQAIQREYLRLLDPLKSGDVEARTFNAFDELSVYADRHATAVATSLLKTELKNSELGKAGSRDDVPANWEEIRPGFFAPKIVADAMRPILEPDVIRNAAIFQTLRAFQKFTKALELGFSLFHMKAMTLMAANNMRWSHGDFVRALASDNSSPEFQAQERDGALYGLETSMTSKPYEAYRALKPSSIPSRADVLRNTFGIKQIREFGEGITHQTFDVVQRKFKVMDYSLQKAAWLAKNPEAGDIEYGKAMRSIAKEVNAVYGGLNWDVMGVSNNWLEVVRAVMLAPDWTFSNLANLKYTMEGGPGGNAARMFWIRSFTTGAALTQAMSLMVSGQTSSHWNEVYLGKDKKGKEMYSNMFFAGAPKDATTWFNQVIRNGALEGTAQFASFKAGPIVGMFPRLLMNKDWQGKDIVKKEDSPLEKTKKEAIFAAGELVPVPFSFKDPVMAMIGDPDQDYSYRDFLLGLVGANVVHRSEGGETKQPPKSRGGFHLPGVKRGGVRLPGERKRR